MDFLAKYFSYENKATVCGLTDELNILYIYNYFLNNDKNVLIVVNSLFDANKLYQRLKTYTSQVCLFPMDDFLSSVALAISPDLKIRRLETLENIKTGKNIVVTNLMGYLRFLPALAEQAHLRLAITKDEEIARDELLGKLDELGYHRTSLVTATGEYAVRGYIIDIFPVEENHPLRLEFFGEVVEKMRFFNEDTQLSINEVEKINILPFEEVITSEHNSLYDYLNNPGVFIIDEHQIANGYKKICLDIAEYKESKNVNQDYKYMYDISELNPDYMIKIETLANIDGAYNFNSKPLLKYNGNYEQFAQNMEAFKVEKTVVICLSKEKQMEKISTLFTEVNIGSIKEHSINILLQPINEGFIFKDYVVVSEYDIDDVKKISNYKNTFKMGRKIKNFDELKIGDYVVHSLHGIGIYGGIVPIAKMGMVRDYIKIDYLGNDKVYIPVEKISTIYKYSDADGIPPRINKLNSMNWVKTKMRVQSRIKDISDELIKLYAARANIKGPIFKDFPEEDVFAAQFAYNETSDQSKCIKEVLHDLSSAVPMDRLLCGDVGFGKTEVAFRGAFKAVINGYQVAYLCPTTLLSRQQYLNALERFKEFPVNIALLNRFTSQKEANRIFNGLKDGSIDIVFGTHRLFNEKIEYAHLGLLIIDEEQRFGVSHKEKIKELKQDVNVLTLSATPIPRTLKMAMSGLRDLSIIDTAPINRYPVQTYVLEENPILIKDAVYKELARNGQVFILYNKVASIVDELTRIKLLVPEARIVIAHGQMEKNELEQVVTDFVDYKYDILLCTTIIETGIDIPNVNTLIILDADNFGLSQLYQIRGRVGRSDKIAYAYLMYNPAKLLTETAIKRLKSIKDFTELGSGYKIAMRDLSIRGAGDLLGSEQAGFVDSVGLELYTQMINNEIKKIKGEYVEEEDSDQNPLIEVENHINDDYVEEESLKIEIHQLINTIKDEESLNMVRAEIEDRFGQISANMDIYMHEEWFEKLAMLLNIKRVRQTETLIEIELPEELSNKIQGDKLFLVAYNINPKFKLSYRMRRIYISLPKINLEKHFIYYVVKLLNEIQNTLNFK